MNPFSDIPPRLSEQFDRVLPLPTLRYFTAELLQVVVPGVLLDVLDDDRLERWRDHVETGNPFEVAAWACSDISEECWCAGWLIGCSFGILELSQAGGGPYGQWQIDADDAARIVRLYERLGGNRWPEYADAGIVLVPWPVSP